MEWLADGILWVLSTIFEPAFELLRGPLVALIESMNSYIFDSMGSGLTEVQEILGHTPESYNAAIYDIVTAASEATILPISMAVFAYVSTYEIITSLSNASSIKEFDMHIVIKWLIKVIFSLLVLANTFNIVEWIFSIGPLFTDYLLNGDVALNVMDTSVIVDGIITLTESMSIWQVIGYVAASAVMGLAMVIMQIVLTTTMLFRFMNIYLTISLAPIPMAMFGSREHYRVGESYIKTILSYVLEIFLMILCIAIYTGMINAVITDMIANSTYDSIEVFKMLAVMVVMIMSLKKTHSLAREVLG